MASNYFFVRNGKQEGPVPFEILRAMARAERLKPTDKVQEEGKAAWIAAGSVQGLFDVTVAKVSPTPAPPVNPATRDEDAHPLPFAEKKPATQVPPPMPASVATIKRVEPRKLSTTPSGSMPLPLEDALLPPANLRRPRIKSGILIFCMFVYAIGLAIAQQTYGLIGVAFFHLSAGAAGAALIVIEYKRKKIPHHAHLGLILLVPVYAIIYLLEWPMGIRARLEAAMPTRRVALAALMIGATAVGYEYYRYREWKRRTDDMFRKTMAIANGDDGDEASKQTVTAELEKWLTSMQAGETGEDFWSGSNYSRLFSVRSGTILKVSTSGNTATAKVRIDSSNKAGTQITVTWEVTLRKESRAWKITDLRDPDSSTTRTPEARREPLITRGKYESIAIGSTLETVEKMLGKGEEQSRVEFGGVTTAIYLWKNYDGSNFLGTFSNTKLIAKSQFGLTDE